MNMPILILFFLFLIPNSDMGVLYVIYFMCMHDRVCPRTAKIIRTSQMFVIPLEVRLSVGLIYCECTIPIIKLLM